MLANRDVGLACQLKRQVPGILLTDLGGTTCKIMLAARRTVERSVRAVSGPICARTSLDLSVMAFLCKTIARRVICIEKAKWNILPFSGVVDTDPFR